MTMLRVGCEENRAENRGLRMWSFGGRPMLRRRGAGVGERRNSVIIGAGDADTDRVAPGSRLSFRSGEAALIALARDTGITYPGRATPAFAGGAKIRDPGATRGSACPGLRKRNPGSAARSHSCPSRSAARVRRG